MTTRTRRRPASRSTSWSSEYGLRIPDIVEQLNEEAPGAVVGLAPAAATGDPTMIKVLIVDDIPETRDHLSRLLGMEREIDVAGTASTGEEAIQMAMDMRPDVIVMDINMPGMDGIAAAEIISQRLPNSPIIMMSVHGEAEHLKRSMLAGAREFLVKPFSADEFATSIKRVHERELVRREQIQATRDASASAGAGADGGDRGPPGRRRLLARRAASGGRRWRRTWRWRIRRETEPAGGARRRQPPVRRRRRPAEPEPEEPLRCSTRSAAASRTATSSSR